MLWPDWEARLKCMHGAADILFTGENRYLSEPSLFPHESSRGIPVLTAVSAPCDPEHTTNARPSLDGTNSCAGEAHGEAAPLLRSFLQVQK